MVWRAINLFTRRPVGRTMRSRLLVAAALLGAGALTLLYAASQGEAEVALFLFIPVVLGHGPWGALAGLLLFAGLVALAWSWAGLEHAPWNQKPWAGAFPRATEPTQEEGPRPPPEPVETKAGGFILLGPIPIAFGTTKGLAWAMLALAVAAFLLLLLVPRLIGGAP